MSKESKCKTCGDTGKIEEKTNSRPMFGGIMRAVGTFVKEIPCPDCKPEEPEAGEFTKDLRKMLAGKQTTLKLKRIYTAAREAGDIIDHQAAELQFIKDEIYEAYIHNEVSPELYGKLSSEQVKDKP